MLFRSPDVPSVARSVTTVRSFVNGVVDESQGPRTPPGNPYTDPGAWVTVSKVQYNLQTQDTAGNTGPATGVTVTDDDADIVVTE